MNKVKVDKRKNKKVIKGSGWYLLNIGLVLFAIGFVYYFLEGL